MRLYAQIVGFLFLVIALATVVTGVTNSGLLFGIFDVTPVAQTVIHFLTAILALVAVYSKRDVYLSTYVKVFGVVYAVVALWGLPALAQGLTGSSDVLFGLIHVNLPTELLHIAIAAGGLYYGFAHKADRVADRV